MSVRRRDRYDPRRASGRTHREGDRPRHRGGDDRRAHANAADAGVAGWTEFMLGEMEQVPLPDASTDVVISNGVLNLSARKSRALAEIFRVLKPGGRIALADLTVEAISRRDANDQSAWAG